MSTDLRLAPQDEEAIVARIPADIARISDGLSRRLQRLREQTRRAVREKTLEALLVTRIRAVLLHHLEFGASPDDLITAIMEDNQGHLALEPRKLRIAIAKMKSDADKTASLAAENTAGATPPADDPGDATEAGTTSAPADPATGVLAPTRSGMAAAVVIPTPAPKKTTTADAPATTTVPGLTPEQAARVAELGVPPKQVVRMLAKPPAWASEDYERDYPELAHQSGESDADYRWRLWTTLPPWADEFPRQPHEKTAWDHLTRCWEEGSPQKRAADQARLPGTAR